MQSAPLLGRARSAPLASGHVQLPPRARPEQQGPPVPTGPADGRGDRRVMRVAGESPERVRLRAIVVIVWRAGLRISEALALDETDLDRAVARWSSAAAYAEFGIGRVMPGRSLCRARSLVVVCWLLSGGLVG
jgi:hypothetical protein